MVSRPITMKWRILLFSAITNIFLSSQANAFPIRQPPIMESPLEAFLSVEDANELYCMKFKGIDNWEYWLFLTRDPYYERNLSAGTLDSTYNFNPIDPNHETNYNIDYQTDQTDEDGF